MTIATGEQALASDVNKLSAGLFGDGSDGDVTIVGAPTTLTRDMHYANLTINASCQLKTDGYVVHVSETLTFADATAKIICNGNDGSGTTPGAAHVGYLGGKAGATPDGDKEGAGGGGGGTILVFAYAITGAGTIEAKGGAGGDAVAGAATGIFTGQAGTACVKGSVSGGKGGDSGAGRPGGAGGAATTPSRSPFQMNDGGAGGGGGSQDNAAANTGGGGGGGAGHVFVLYRTKANALTIVVTGGAGGAKQGTGNDGTAGTAGASFEIAT